MQITLGIENLVNCPPAFLQGKKLGLLCNQSSTDSRLRHSRDILRQAFPGQLTCIFSPQHGFFSEKQDNMIESSHGFDGFSELPVFSLYGDRRKPDAAMMDPLDILLIDLQDVGTRVYTFIYTLAYCLEAAAQYGKQVVVLDRPNPLGGEEIEGNLLEEEFRSFVGLFPLPMRHGLTIGEIARLFNKRYQADLSVIPMGQWQRHMYFPETGLPWIFPSPNMPTFASSLVYPGQVIWEGTNISEGRGTALPFELFGAPYCRHEELANFIMNQVLAGGYLRPVIFEPTSNKWAGKSCIGFQLHVTDRRTFRPYRLSLALYQAFFTLYPNDFEYKKPPYEYEYEKLPMDLILGSKTLRKQLEAGEDILEIEKCWQPALEEFRRQRQEFLLY